MEWSSPASRHPRLSIIIPCRNEERFIARCLDSIIANDYPKDRLEVLVVDGMSEDRTREIVEAYARQYCFVRLLDNPGKIPSAAFNRGVAAASGDIVMLMSSHSTYPKDYISKCVKYLEEYEADNVGGVLKVVPGAGTAIARGIAVALSHPFGSGNAYVKVGSEEPRWADTAAFGCYRKEVFERIGPFNENLAGSSDLDFNKRLKAAGGKILLVPEIVINYYADPDLKAFWWHNFSDGVWATYVLKFRSKAFSWRHWVPLAFVSSLIGSAAVGAVFPPALWLCLAIGGFYGLVNVGVSTAIAVCERDVRYLWTLPIVFATRHLAHGVGALWGLILCILPGVQWRGRRGRKV
jgi:cellulose synthase/poly-beta-1,6-N-acetylglucosamine synthase-like glycosyltransferase